MKENQLKMIFKNFVSLKIEIGVIFFIKAHKAYLQQLKLEKSIRKVSELGKRSQILGRVGKKPFSL